MTDTQSKKNITGLEIITSSFKKGWGAFISNIIVFIVSLLIAALGSILIVTFAPLWYGFIHMVVKAASGEKVEIKDVFYGFKSVNVFIRSWIYWIITIIVLIIITTITTLLASITPILGYIGMFLNFTWIFITLYMIYIYVMTPSENIIYAYKESFNLFKKNIVITIIAYIVTYILSIIGMLLLGVGLLITVPISLLFTTFVLKTITRNETKTETSYGIVHCRNCGASNYREDLLEELEKCEYCGTSFK
ncbi:hypothetical protein MmiEs2_01000 [Methanimicrococcus stummii]|uniref:Uncharacterized protein n=1 Tax=Methanimicrococcus stummii TaxID=3028294 RepID=A0AA96ZXN7_9EURY|nr:hypothetical protein [Methanimicrococcus sp. Es2]WNY27921.1 hypothetical protein MmiEs2_01000 [Methanimicrococcus sp. Es2]